jgi:hypothetical protein
MKRLAAALSTSMLLGLCVALPARHSSAQDTSVSPVQDSVRAQLEAQQNAAAQTAQTYREKDNAALLKLLSEQSVAKKEPFNSLAFRELKGRRDVDPAALASIVRQTDNGDALLPLLLLRRLNEADYRELPPELRAKVLTDALQAEVTFNAWGLPGFYQEDAAKALIDTGLSAVPALRRMLTDTRPALVFGSKEYMMFKRYQFRLCDYALYYLEKIQGNADFVMPVSVDERDALIRAMLK